MQNMLAKPTSPDLVLLSSASPHYDVLYWWSGFNCPWDKLTFTWLKITLCLRASRGGYYTKRHVKALPEKICRGQGVSVLHTYVIRHTVCVFMLCKHCMPPFRKFTHCLMCWCSGISGIIPSEGWADICCSPREKGSICLRQGVHSPPLFVSTPSASPGFTFWGPSPLRWSSIDSSYAVMSSGCLMEGQHLCNWSWSESARGNTLRLAENMN